ncbi:SubName: Full=Uncharacterized protein {ECO:0000313/EMBL:CCA69339.1} [Serendipita indica DSM 11827]|nr:SubName: Full=Uncharacterized protein {ECO:0000313/EMBL:CCA69339.1} [Serendipita indica DSM 11827]
MVIIDDKDQKWQPAGAPPPYLANAPSPAVNVTPPSPARSAYSQLSSSTTPNLPLASSSGSVRGPSFVQQGHTDDPPPFTSHPLPTENRRWRYGPAPSLLDLPQHILLYIVQISCLPTRSGYQEDDTSRARTYGYNADAKGEYRGTVMSGRRGRRQEEEYIDEWRDAGTSRQEFGVGLSEEEEWAEHAMGLYHLAMNVRLVCRGLYVACMHVLRSTYLPLYSLNIKAPYTSDPFPASTDAPTYTPTPYSYSPTTPTTSNNGYMPANSSPLLTTQRETRVLDQFLLLKLHQDVLSSESMLHLSSSVHTPSSTFSDLFNLHQPTARLEDLVRHYGLQNGSITLAPSSSRLVSFDYVSIKLSEGGRRVGLVISDTKGRKRVVAEYLREDRNEKLEIAAKKLAKELLAILKRSRSR